MPRKNSTVKPVHSFRLSLESFRQLREMAGGMGRSEGDVVEIAIDRMYREEIRFNRTLREADQAGNQYHVDTENEDKDESNRNTA